MVKRYAKTPVGAHYGLRDWLLQRLTAVVMAGYTLWLFAYLLMRTPRGYTAWSTLFSQTWFQVGTMLFIAALLYHAWIGMRDILMDYMQPTGIRLLSQFVVGIVLVFYLIWSASILWGR